MEFPSLSTPQMHPHSQPFAGYLAEQERDPEAAAAIKRARKRLANRIDATRVPLAALRLARGLSQTQLAVHVDTSQSRISRIEGGREEFSMSMGKRLASALGIDMNTLADAHTATTEHRQLVAVAVEGKIDGKKADQAILQKTRKKA